MCVGQLIQWSENMGKREEINYWKNKFAQTQTQTQKALLLLLLLLLKCTAKANSSVCVPSTALIKRHTRTQSFSGSKQEREKKIILHSLFLPQIFSLFVLSFLTLRCLLKNKNKDTHTKPVHQQVRPHKAPSGERTQASKLVVCVSLFLRLNIIEQKSKLN